MSERQNSALPDPDDVSPGTGLRGRFPKRAGSRSRLSKVAGLLVRAVAVLAVMAVVSIAVLFFILSKGPVPNEQLRAQMESEITALLGVGREARIGETRIAFGERGLLAFDVRDVNILEAGKINLGVAEAVAINVKALPLMRGEVVAQSMSFRGASLALAPFLPESLTRTDGSQPAQWSRTIDFNGKFRALGTFLRGMAQSVENAGLRYIRMSDAKLIGFEALGLRSPTGKLIDFVVERDASLQDGLTFRGELDTQHSRWAVQGSWQKAKGGGDHLKLDVSGLDMRDLLHRQDTGARFVDVDSPVKISALIPYSPSGAPQQAVVNMRLAEGELAIGQRYSTRLTGADLNLRFLPSKNQIELERSPVKFAKSSAVLLGGIRYPVSSEEGEDSQPLFELLANNVEAYGLSEDDAPGRGALQIAGKIDPQARTLLANKVLLKTPDGDLQGTASADLNDVYPHFKFDLNIAGMAMGDFKQLWPPIIAPRLHSWMQEGLRGGKIIDGSINVDLPPQYMVEWIPFAPENLTMRIPVSGVSIKTLGELPPVSSAVGVVNVEGMETDVVLDKGHLDLGKFGRVNVARGRVKVGDFYKKRIPTELTLSAKGDASSMAYLGQLKPLSFSHTLGLKPKSLKGTVAADIKTNFNLGREADSSKVDWSASIKLAKVTSTSPFLGRDVRNADVSIKAKPGIAKIDGVATVDGVKAKLAMVEHFGANKSKGQRSFTMTLDAKARKKMGFDSSPYLTGPVEVAVTTTKDGVQQVDVDMRKAVLSLPWVNWSKGKGIGATASFVLERSKDKISLKRLSLNGKRFKAKGNLSFDKAGLVKADLRDVVLNKLDDFDVKTSRVKGGYNVAINARSYDGRAIIRSLLNNEVAQAGKGKTVKVTGKIAKLVGFGGQSLSAVSVDFVLQGSRISRASLRAKAPGNAATAFVLTPTSGGMQTKMSTANAGSTLRFLDFYSKMRGGQLEANLVRDKSQVFRGDIEAYNFTLIGEPRLAKLLRPPSQPLDIDGRRLNAKLPPVDPGKVKVQNLLARIEKGRGFLLLKKGRLSGGDASAAFDGTVYDRNNRINIRGTYLPAKTLNRLVSKIPILGLAFGKGKVNGLLGITFRLRGRYDNPQISVNPLSVIAPGVFRQLFKF